MATKKTLVKKNTEKETAKKGTTVKKEETKKEETKKTTLPKGGSATNKKKDETKEPEKKVTGTEKGKAIKVAPISCKDVPVIHPDKHYMATLEVESDTKFVVLVKDAKYVVLMDMNTYETVRIATKEFDAGEFSYTVDKKVYTCKVKSYKVEA